MTTCQHSHHPWGSVTSERLVVFAGVSGFGEREIESETSIFDLSPAAAVVANLSFPIAAGGCVSQLCYPSQCLELPVTTEISAEEVGIESKRTVNHIYFVVVADVLRESTDVGLPGCRIQRVPVPGVWRLRHPSGRGGSLPQSPRAGELVVYGCLLVH